MEPENPREPSLGELCDLNIFCNLAYAVRCARRVLPRFRLPETEADVKEKMGVVHAAIRWAEEFVRKGSAAMDRGVLLVDATIMVAEMTWELTDYAAYAAHHAVRGSVFAAQNPQPLNQEEFLEIVAAAYGAGQVITANVTHGMQALVAKSLRADYDKLLALTSANGSQRGEVLDSTEAGPLGRLWQGDPPAW